MAENKCTKCSDRGEYSTLDGCGCCLTDHICDCPAGVAKQKSNDVENSTIRKFQVGVAEWLVSCFGKAIATDKIERNHRFIEEALELVQACGGTREDCHMLVDYTFDRPVGEPTQEVGGVMVTLAALCFANNMHMDQCGPAELARIWKCQDKIREKQLNKPRSGPYPSELEKSDE